MPGLRLQLVHALENVKIQPSPVDPIKYPDCWYYHRKQVFHDKKFYYITRLIAFINNLKDPEGNLFLMDPKYHICHHCDNPKCFNPEHLFVGTALDNNRDRNNKGRQAKGEQNGGCKISELEVIQIIDLYDSGRFTLIGLGTLYNLGLKQIHRIVTGESWKYLLRKDKNVN
jgi:hypothetical protein